MGTSILVLEIRRETNNRRLGVDLNLEVLQATVSSALQTRQKAEKVDSQERGRLLFP